MNIIIALRPRLLPDPGLKYAELMSFEFGVMLHERGGGWNSPLTEMSPHTFSAGIAGSLVEAPLNLDDAKVLFSRFDCAGFVLLRAVYRTKDCCAVLVACPTKISHRFHNDH